MANLEYGYRSSSVTPSQLIVSADLRVTPGSRAKEQAEVAEIVRWRREHQPGGSNAGSVFTNPEDDSAGRLIDEAGLKGFGIGTAHVSEKHANFIQAERGGRADDVRAVMEHVRRVVAERSGVSLRTEVRLLGFGDGETGAVPETEAARASSIEDPSPEGSAMTPVEAPSRRRGGGGSGGSGGSGKGGSGRSSGTGGGGRRRMDPRISARRTAVIRQQGRRRLRLLVIGLVADSAAHRRVVPVAHADLRGARRYRHRQHPRDDRASDQSGGPGEGASVARRQRRRGGGAHRAAAVGAQPRRSMSRGPTVCTSR